MAPRDPVKSARRVLEILERFEAEKRPLGVSEIAQVLGYPLSSTSMLLNTLARLGYLNLDPASRKFAPTMSVAMLGDWIVSGDEGRSRVTASTCSTCTCCARPNRTSAADRRAPAPCVPSCAARRASH